MRQRRLNESFLAWLAEEEPDAFVLLAVVRLRHVGDRHCHVPNMLAYWLGWHSEKRVKAARKVLLDLGLLEMVSPATGHKLALYRFAPGVGDHAPLPTRPTVH
jgi:hypothetical protein